MNKKDQKILLKIRDELEVIGNLLNGFDEERFFKDERTQRAIAMTLINIGELVKLLSNDVRVNNRHIPWRSIAGLRDVVAHRYQSIKMEDIWNTAKGDVPLLKEQLGELINAEW